MATTRTTHRHLRPLMLALLAAGVLTTTTAMAQDAPCEACDCGHARPPHGAEFDADGDGGLSVDELTAMLMARSEHRAERIEAHDARRQARMERRGDAPAEDGERSARRAEMQQRMAEHHARFAAMDTDGDGLLNADEAAAAATGLLAEFDADGDGVLRRDEMPHPGPHARGRRGGGDEEGRRGGRRGGQRGQERGPDRD